MKTDTQLRIDVVEELAWDSSVNSSQIGVDVKDGVVTISGYVDSFSDKWNAVKAIEKVAGVRALLIELNVHLPVLSERTDFDIAMAAEIILLWSTHLVTEYVNLIVENGWITLQGQVEYEYQRLAATAAFSQLGGVRGIINHINVKPAVAFKEVRTQVKSALTRHGLGQLVDVSVAVNGTDVTLEGQVPTWSDRNSVRRSAWNTIGVRHVIDHLTFRS